jgi:PAS domain S-box-containing protein
MPIGSAQFQTMAAQEPRLAPYAASQRPAWLWSADGSRILWCNAAAASVLGVADPQLLEKPRSAADPHRRQVTRLAPRLAPDGATRLERLRGFGARLGQLMTCACSRFVLRDGESAILLVAMQPAARVAQSAAERVLPPTIDTNDRILNEPVIDPPITEPQTSTAALADAGPDSDLPAEPSLVDDLAASDRANASATPPAVDRSLAPAAAPAARTPLRFVWQIDAAGRFSVLSDDFLRVAGEPTAALLGQPWAAIAQALDPDDRIAQAIANRETWSAIAVQWPIAAQHKRAVVELSGMPMYDGARNFAGYRGFGIYRQPSLPADADETSPAEADSLAQPAANLSHDPMSETAADAPAAPDNPSLAETETVEPPRNVVPFPLSNDARTLSLSAVENHAFDEIARRLTQKVEDADTRQQAGSPAAPDKRDQTPETEQPGAAPQDPPAWLAAAATPPRGDSARDRMLLDLVPSGILIYRLDRLLYANRTFLTRTGFDNLHALQEAGGLDALYVEPGVASASSASDQGMPLKIAPPAGDGTPSDARLFSILWDGEAAHALILQGAQAPAAQGAAPAQSAAAAPARPADTTFETILETVSDGIVLFDRSGEIVSCNRSAETLFGIGAADLHRLNFADLFADESQRVVLDSFEALEASTSTNPRDGVQEVFGRVRGGGYIPLSMTMGRGGDGARFFAIFRNFSPPQKNDTELLNVRRAPERASGTRTEEFARISHEIRGSLNAIVGSANVMIDERFGALGNERYAAYPKDVRAAAERAIAVLDGIANISSIEAGKHELKLVGQNLNEMVEQCVGVLQPQANRERVIIRTSLAHALPQVIADTQALRQITMNIVTSSIRFSKAGGQVIVSTAPGDNGGAVLRVRDSGRGLSEAELASAMGAHRGPAPLERIVADRGAIDLSLARALAEANRAQFQIKTTESSGTLIEVAFSNLRALAG